ncbi:MAG: methionine synthase [Bacteroidaceae bacterium]|nr:methionine synthase [Bacteroidaceae bacterium]
MLQRKGFSGNMDSLCLTNPDAVAEVHRLYLEAGADIIETNSFSAQRVSQSEFGMADRVRDINLSAARLARAEADRMTHLTPGKPRFVAGSVGPTNQSCSISPDIDNPALRSIDFDTLVAAYTEQMTALIDGGVDLLQIETIFDSLNAKAALSASVRAFSESGRTVPVLLSVTLADQTGRMLSGQTIEAFLITIRNFDVFCVGFNCSFGTEQMHPFLKRLASVSPYYVSAYPNAGLPNDMGEYDQTPEEMADCVGRLLEEGLVNIVGGCCGTTPEHIRAIAGLMERPKPVRTPPRLEQSSLCLAGQDAFVSDGSFINVGERCNVAGSRKFLRLISEKSYDEALRIARKQVTDGAMVLDVNMDDAMLDSKAEMVTFLNLMGSDPEIARIPWMIDSSRFDIIEAALKCVQGKAIVNSLSLKEGEEQFLDKARRVHDLGAALVVMAFDEEGQATTYDKKVSVCRRAYNLLVNRLGFDTTDIIFDPNVLTVATGMKEHDRYALDFIEATRWIHENLPGAHVSGGISNLSFAFRGNNYIREAMHAVFLYHAINAGLDMAIVNPSSKVMYQDIPEELLMALEDVILCRREDATERLVSISSSVDVECVRQSDDNDTAMLSVSERLMSSLRKGSEENLRQCIEVALQEFPSPAAVIEGPLMEGMRKVGELFGEGKMFLPQVIKTARTMKTAISYLEPYMANASRVVSDRTKATYILATVKGDVHDIGKNIASVVLACNGFRVIDLGVMVPPETIVETAKKEKADFICLSGLITPSLNEMCVVAKELKSAGIDVPLFISGATTSETHTAVKIAPLYDGPVFHLKDASQNPVIASELMGEGRDRLVSEQNDKNRRIASARNLGDGHHGVCACSHGSPRRHPVVRPSFLGCRRIVIRISDVRPFINWIHFDNLWRVSDEKARTELRKEAETLLDGLESYGYMQASVGFFPASSGHGRISCGDVDIRVPQRLADYVGKDDYVGAFAVTVCEELADRMQGDIMLQSLCDRLAEAASEYLHMKVRRELWGYDKDEDITIDEMFKARYKGIRPAVGYSALPDQSQIFSIAGLIDFESVGIRLTENGAMYPQSSVCGIYIANPEARYF